MKAFTREHAQAGFIFLAIFALTAMMFFSSCTTIRHDEHTGCYASKHYVGYGPGGYKQPKIRNWRRASFSH